MSNLFDMRCPQCGDENQLDIHASIWIRVCTNGTDADASNCGDHEFSPDSTACCQSCGHWASVAAFTAEASS
ncbi:MAG: hypothetical protein J0H19_00270 [Rhodospirillales bacterium]|nr:hypothetical protein [Rhodospirillales bacterium]MBN8903822.1 hypothetical protein [Rhodospirillales bacterium]MBN8925037.1 hypothetical protein [Rhodospirillales bacterium]